jgi:protein-tyrosine-phosphatase
MELTRVQAVEVEYWPTQDPTAFEGSREQLLDAYRAVRDELQARIEARFAVDRAAD